MTMESRCFDNLAACVHCGHGNESQRTIHVRITHTELRRKLQKSMNGCELSVTTFRKQQWGHYYRTNTETYRILFFSAGDKLKNLCAETQQSTEAVCSHADGYPNRLRGDPTLHNSIRNGTDRRSLNEHRRGQDSSQLHR